MKKAKASLLLHPVFILSLFVLIVNDAYWKYEYSNWLIGKLSDVAGLVVLPVVLSVLLPKIERKKIIVCCALFFVWWKSPLSQPVINAMNLYWQLPVSRVVDYTDLVALLVLLPAANLQPKTIALKLPVLNFLRGGIAVITLFSLFATSMPYRSLFQAHPDNQETYFGETYRYKTDAKFLLQTLDKKGITHRLDSVMYYPVTNQQALYYKHNNTADTTVQWQQLSQDSTVYIKWEEHRPYYLIPYYETTIDNTRYVFRNIRFTLSENTKRTKTNVTVQMFQQDGVSSSGFINKKTREEYKKIFEALFQQPAK